MGWSRTRILIRADVGSGVGFGHLVRCLAIADQLIRRGAEVTVATRYPSDEVASRVRDVGAHMHAMRTKHGSISSALGVLPSAVQYEDARDAVSAGGPPWDAVIVDHYGLDAEWERAVRCATSRVVVVDDLANRPHTADILVDHNWYGPDTADRYKDLVEKGTLQLLGPRYCLLHPAYAAARAPRQAVRVPPASALVNFGGTDAAGQTLIAAKAAIEYTTLKVEIVVGSRAALSAELEAFVKSEPRATLHISVPNLTELLGQVDLVVGASGTGTWERICMRVPSIVTTVSESQSGVTAALAEAGACIWLGVASRVNAADYVDALCLAMAGRLPAPPVVVDGYGSARVALAILGADLQHSELRAARREDDAGFVSAWAAAMPGSGPTEWRTAEAEFYDLLEAKRELKVREIDGVPVGVEYLLPNGDTQRLVDRCLEERSGTWRR